MAIDLAARFPQLLPPFDQRRLPTPAQTQRITSTDNTIDGRGRPTKPALVPNVQVNPDRDPEGTSQRPEGQLRPSFTNIAPSEPRGSIIDVFV